MGRKMKSVVALFVILGLIYWQQPSALGSAFAKEEENTESYETSEMPEEGVLTDEAEEPSKEDSSEGSEEEPGESKEGTLPEESEEKPPEESGENPPEGSGEDIPKEPEEESRIECFESDIPPGDGQNGYYVTRPEVEVRHVSKIGVTRYCFTDGDGHKEEGKLTKAGDRFRIEKDRFREGSNHLSVWMEDESGKRREEYVLERSFLIDTAAPSVRVQAPMGLDSWYQKEVFIHVSGEDGEKGSKIEEISCFLGKQKIGSSKKPSAGFLVSFASSKGEAVPVKVRVTDRAGNVSDTSLSLYIDQHPPRTSIEGVQDYMITSQPVRVEYLVQEENILEKRNAGAQRKNPQGETEFLPAEEWKEQEGVSSVQQILTEDGIYQLSVSAWDQAGYEGSSKGQIIIDSENPIIRHVDEVDGKYLKNFCWEYPIEETIQDFTSYTYSVYLDGRPYHIGENISREGMHVLEVQAQDSAGNIGRAEADFAIDNTAPQIVFADVEKGQTYEPGKKFEVTLKDQEDFIEEIRINGKLQKTSEKKKKYSYSMEECRDYEVLVKACDRAGNQAVCSMDFAIAQEQGLLHKFTGPIKKILKDPLQAEGKKQILKEESEVPGKPAHATWIIILGALIAGGAAAWKVKFDWKKQL